MLDLLSLRSRPDGVLCFNDQVAAGALQAALEADCAVPGQVAVIGAGNAHYAGLLRVPLSSVDPQGALTGKKAAELLTESITAKSKWKRQVVVLRPSLIERESTRRG
jgi:LacI family transcriptional regulator